MTGDFRRGEPAHKSFHFTQTQKAETRWGSRMSRESRVGAGPCGPEPDQARAAPAADARRTLVAQKSGSLLPAWMKELRETHRRQHSPRSTAGPPPGLTRSRWAALRRGPAVLPAVDPSSSSHLRRTGSTGEEPARPSQPAGLRTFRIPRPGLKPLCLL